MSGDREWRGYLADLALAGGVALVLLFNAQQGFSAAGDLSPLDYVLLVVACLILVLRRWAPVAVLVVCTALILAYFLRVHPDSTAALPVLVAVYTAVRAGHRLIAVGVSALFLAGTLLDQLSRTNAPVLEVVHRYGVLPIGWFVAAIVLAEVSRQREASLAQRAADAERTREETALRRVDEERLRIARELHDSLTHSISVIKVQAGVAVHLAQKRGEQVPEALMAIQDASRDAIRELRSTLDVLRTDEGGAERRGLDQLPELVERVRSAGVPATVTVRGARRPLPVEVDRTAYRIVQEALTNVTKHAGASTATVYLDYGHDRLSMRVDDDGRGTREAGPVPGVGLIGMRERVTSLGGRLSAEPKPEGGFSVRAELPLTEELTTS